MTSVSVISDDLIEELVDENRRQFKELLFADKCLNVMTEFKSFIDFISIQFINHLESEVWKKFEQLSAKVDNICDIKKLVVNNGVLSKELLKSVIQENSNVQNNPNKDILLKQLLVDNSTGDERQLHSQTKPNSSTNGSNKSLISKVSHNSGKFKCPKKNCQKAFPSRNLLSRHYYNCHSEKRFACQFPECSYKTSMKWNFKKHSATHITKSGHYKCRYFRCERVYKNLEDVVKHMKVVHQSAGMTTTVKANIAKPVTSMKNAPKRLKCQWPGCQYSTNNSSSMTVHKASHNSTGDETQLHVKPKLKTSTISSNKSIVSENGDKSGNFKCRDNKCPMHFNSIQSLNNHLKSCHSERRLICNFPGCHYRTSKNWNLKRHLAKHSNAKRTESVHYKCRYMRCQRSYKYLKDLRKHEEIVHQSE